MSVHSLRFLMAAAYLFHITSNHPFLDGNKRAGALSALIFLDVNGVSALPEPDALEAVTMAVASGQMHKEELTAWFRHAIGEAADSDERDG